MRNMTPKQRAWQVTHQTDHPLEENLIELVIQKAVDQERERCAVIVETLRIEAFGRTFGLSDYIFQIAKTIRSGG